MKGTWEWHPGQGLCHQPGVCCNRCLSSVATAVGRVAEFEGSSETGEVNPGELQARGKGREGVLETARRARGPGAPGLQVTKDGALQRRRVFFQFPISSAAQRK